MKIKIFRYVLIPLFSFAAVLPIFSQDDFILFTHYDQLTWSPSGEQIAFRCLLLDESNPGNIFVNVLIKDLETKQLGCLNPQPERFVISKSKKYLLFSSIYGLYIQTIESEPRAGQIIFRDPAVSWTFKDFGFYEETETIYVERYNYLSAQTNRENFWIDVTKMVRPINFNPVIKKPGKVKELKPFNLPVDGFLNKIQNSITLKNESLIFVKNKTGDFDMVLKDSDSGREKVLVKNCRPRLLSANPDRSLAIVSLFENNGHVAYLFNAEAKKLTLIKNQRYYSVSWFENHRYVCINEDGLFLKKIYLKAGKKLNDWILPEWCQNIDLSFPKYLFDFYNREKLPEKKSFNEKSARIEYQKEHFLRSRIVLINKDGTRKIIVDEMNNIPDRSYFRDLNH